MKGSEEERAELDRCIELLGGHTRSGKLLAHIGQKYFQGQEEQLTEFNIATEVFGRSPKSFVAADDAVVRVEAHRLRKKLRDSYTSGEGAATLRIVLPMGSYAPKFERGPAPIRVPRKRRLLALVLAACVLGVIVTAIWIERAIDRPRPTPVA